MNQGGMEHHGGEHGGDMPDMGEIMDHLSNMGLKELRDTIEREAGMELDV
jgi:hypothetical protein